MPPPAVSFTVRRPTSSFRASSPGIVFPGTVPGVEDGDDHTDSSDEGSLIPRAERRKQSFKSKKRKALDQEAPLVIPTQPNPDWREAARKRRAASTLTQPRARPSFIPTSAATGADGSVGGLGTRGAINAGPQISGLHLRQRIKPLADKVDVAEVVSVDQPTPEAVEETEDQKALRAILAGEDESASVVEIIPVPPLSEADALKQDIEELPEVATADDYERVPISAFGAAMLRGMGWTGGAVAPMSGKRGKNALKEPYLPQARPALLGIGAKEREPDDDGSGKKKVKGREMRYVPVVREDSGRGEHPSTGSGTVSRRSSRSPSRRVRDSDRMEDRDRDWQRSTYADRGRDDESRRRTKEYNERDRSRMDRGSKDRDRDTDRDRGRGRSDDTYRGKREGDAKRYGDQRDRTKERDRRNR